MQKNMGVHWWNPGYAFHLGNKWLTPDWFLCFNLHCMKTDFNHSCQTKCSLWWFLPHPSLNRRSWGGLARQTLLLHVVLKCNLYSYPDNKKIGSRLCIYIWYFYCVLIIHFALSLAAKPAHEKFPTWKKKTLTICRAQCQVIANVNKTFSTAAASH